MSVIQGETIAGRATRAVMTRNRTPAQLYALIVGAVLVGAGIMGLFYNSSFATGDEVPRDAVLGLLDVNAWHNLVHIATGALGLATFASVLIAVAGLGAGGASSTQPALRTTGAQDRREWAAT